MRLWGYYAWHTFWNTIKKMFRSTFLVIILAIFGFGIIFGLIAGVVGSMVEKQQSVETVESSSEADRVQEEATEEEETQKTPQEIAAIKTYVEAGVMIVFLAILLWGMYSGSKDGTDIFQMADVNLLFTAPMKPQSVLMFRLSFQMVATVFASIYLVFQIPNLVVNMGLGASAVVAIFAGWILLLVFQRLMIVLTYTVCTTHEKLKPYVFPLIVGIVVLLGMIAGGTYLANGQNLLEAAHMTFASHWLRYLPVIGWYKGMIMCAVNGELFSFLVYLGLLLVSVAVLIFAIWHMKADFYEDALASAGKRAQMLEAAKEQGISAMILTPHYRHGMFAYPKEEIEEHFRILEPYAQKLGIYLALGTEYHVNSHIVEALDSGRCRTMAGSRYVLCEYSHDSEYAYIYQMTQELVLHGYIPVFAHVERYGALADLQLAEELRNLGAWITVNADAVLGLEGMGPKKYCKKMLKAECVDAIASDSHGIKNRANHMGKCYELIEKKFGREYADQLLVNHPAKILTGEMK